MSVDIDLSGETAIVTGAGRGIGAEIARTLASAGADIVVAARTGSEIEAIVAEVENEHGIEGIAVPTDLTDIDDIERLIEKSVAACGMPTILVNNAGANISGNLLDHTVKEIDTMLKVNLRGLFLLTQRWAQAFRDSPSESGRVINISSVTGDVGVPAMTLYGGTKAGIRAITRGFAAEFAAYGVTVNSISPGLTRVQRTEDLIDDEDADLYALNRIPLARVGKPADVASVCLFFASDLADYVTGTDLLVDGGVAFTAGLYK